MARVSGKLHALYPSYPVKEREIHAICGNENFLLSFSKSLILDKSYWLTGNHIFEFIKIPLMKKWKNISNLEVWGKGSSLKVKVTLDENINLRFQGKRHVEIFGMFSPDLKRECCLKYYKARKVIEAYHSYDSVYFLKFEKATEVKLGSGKFFEDIGYPTVFFPDEKLIEKVNFAESTNTLGGCFYLKLKPGACVKIGKRKRKAIHKKKERVKERDIDKAVVISLINKNTGLPIAAPEYENFCLPYQSSGGYGYVWFRDMAFILSIAPKSILNKSVKSIEKIVKKYSLIPHRVWAWNLELAPSWADGPFVNTPWNYQIDQLASVVAFLSKAKSNTTEHLYNKLLKFTYDNTSLPVICQNCWEDRIGIFTHTTGSVLKAYVCMNDWKRAERLIKNLDIFWDKNKFVMGIEFEEEIYKNAGRTEDLKDIKPAEGREIVLLDSGTFELIDALIDYLGRNFDKNLLEMCLKHLDTAIPDTSFRFSGEKKGLLRKGNVRGIIRYEGDLWRRNRKGKPEKV